MTKQSTAIDSAISTVPTTLGLAANSLANLSKNLPDDTRKAVQILLECQRLIITTGVGKSGHIAQKLSATLTSTGSPSVYLDPMNALHGDLGIVAPEDVLIAFSYSGESKEIIALMPTLRQRKVPVVSITCKPNSTLKQHSTVTLLAPIEREACPLNLAPTTSTTVSMALGDALAVALMTAKNYQSEDFALNHPAGSLGRRLTLRVSDLLSAEYTDQLVSENTRFSDVICAISSNGVGAVCVTKGNRVLGIITDGDIRRTVQNRNPETLSDLIAKEIMTVNPVTITLNTLAADALNSMEQRSSQINVLPVVDSESFFKGILRLHDLVRAGL